MMNCPLYGNAAHTAAAFRFQQQQKNDITSVRTSIAAARLNLMKRYLRSL